MIKRAKALIIPLIGLVLTSCAFDYYYAPQEEESGTPATAVYLGEESFNVEVGYTHRLSTTLAPYYTTNKTFTWSSSDPSVATVDQNGVVTGVSDGTCIITVQSNSKSKVTDTCRVKVYTDTTGVNKVKSQYTYKDYSSNNVYYLSSCPSANEAKIVVIPVWFTDSSTYITEANKNSVRNDIRTAYFGDTESNGWESVKTYYEKDSFGSLSLQGSVTEWFECNEPSTNYYLDNDHKTSALVHRAVSWYKERYRTPNMTDYDRDHDGYIDGVMLIYGAPDYSAMNKSSSTAGNMWAYCYWTQDRYPNVDSPTENVFFWASYDFMYSAGTKAIDRAGSIYGSGDLSHCNIDSHTYIHEMGHVFGLEDYYDYSYMYSPAAGFSMQDENVGAHDPYSRFALGWAKAFVPTSTSTFEVKCMEDYGECVLLSPLFSGSAFDEYILLELFSPRGINKQDCTYRYGYKSTVSGFGVRVWHIDARLMSVDSNYNAGGLTTNARIAGYKVTHATNNCAYKSSGSRAVDYAGSYEYNLLQLIVNDASQSGPLSRRTFLNNEMMFHTGDTFSMSKYATQFTNSGKFNSNIDLGWTVTFNSVTEGKMNITCTKL